MFLSTLFSILVFTGIAFELKINGNEFDESSTYSLSDMENLTFEIDNNLVQSVAIEALLRRGSKAVIKTEFKFSKTGSKNLRKWLEPNFKKNDALIMKATVNYKTGKPIAELFIFDKLTK